MQLKGQSILTGALLALATAFVSTGGASAASQVTFCTSAGMNSAIQPVIYAQNAGLFEKYGVTINRLDLADDTTAVQALVAGSCDMLYAGAGTGMVAIARGADIKIVMSHTPWTDYLLVGQPAIKSVADLKGKIMGTSKIGSLNYQAAAYALRQNGVDPSAVQFVATGGNDSARAQALVARAIDGAVMNGTWSAQALKNAPDLKVVLDVGEIFRDKFLSTAVFARGPLMKSNPDSVTNSIKALIEASRTLQSNEQTAIDSAVKSGLNGDLMKPVYDKIFSASKPYYGVDGGIDPSIVTSTIAILKESGDLTTDISASQVLDLQYMNKALKDLGPYKKT